MSKPGKTEQKRQLRRGRLQRAEELRREIAEIADGRPGGKRPESPREITDAAARAKARKAKK